MPISSYNFVFMMFDKISSAQIKHLRALQLKKFRQKYNQFIVEGRKSIDEFLGSSIRCLGVFGSEEEILRLGPSLPKDLCFVVSKKQLEQISGLKTPQGILAMFEISAFKKIDKQADLVLALEDLRDPGNLGTIIRAADWFGLNQIICSPTSVDCFNSKVVQASMGSLSRVHVHYKPILELVDDLNTHTLVLTDMEGEDYKTAKLNKSILVIGNEGQGVSEGLKSLKHRILTIPRKGAAESLNAAVSASILLAELT